MLEPIKVSVDVNVHLSEKTEGFILDLVKSIMPGVVKAPAATAAKTESKPAAPAAKPESKPAAPAAKPESKPANTASDNISIEDVREALSKKVATHRNEIKEKLTELGAPSVTKLDKSKYSEMFNFLNSLD
jgi:hypothetical protein